ncbi:MAG: HAD family hydrolase [Candidatus Lokiarchaeota archaeon]|nr:HAD family hydrolase [Candidatus Lokiarchaeota archaeon]
MLSEPALFVFDVDGCILDSFNYFMSFLPRILQRFKVSPDPALMAQLREEIIGLLSGKSSPALITKLVLHSAKSMGLGPWRRFKFLVYLGKLYKENVRSVGFVPGALETARFLKERGCKLAAFTTGSSKTFTALFHDKQEFITLLDTWVTRDQVTRMKPDPEGLLLIMKRLGKKNPRRVVMVGDMHHDVAAGIAAGTITIGVKTGVCSDAELKAAGASFVLDSVKDIPSHIARIEALMEGP